MAVIDAPEVEVFGQGVRVRDADRVGQEVRGTKMLRETGEDPFSVGGDHQLYFVSG